MRQGCISLGKVECDSCGNIVPYAARYLVIHEDNGVEVEEGAEVAGERRSYCVTCSESRGYAETREEKHVTVLTFFPTNLYPPPPPED